MINKRYVNIKELSQYTSLPVKTLYDWTSQGKIPSIKLGRRILFDLSDIHQLMNNLKRSNLKCEINNDKIYNILHDSGHTDTTGLGKGGTNV